MIARDPHQEAVLLAYNALELLEDPYEDPDTMELGDDLEKLARAAGCKGPSAKLRTQLEAEMRRLWPGPAHGCFGHASPYLIHVAEKRSEPLWCRRGTHQSPTPAWKEFIAEVVRFGGIYQPVHLRTIAGVETVVAGRKRRLAVITVNRQRFLEWLDGPKSRCRFIATIPAMHVGDLDIQACEDIACSENIFRENASGVDRAFWAIRLSEQGKSAEAVAAQLRVSEKSVFNFLSLRDLCDDGLVELQHERLALDAGYRLAKEPHARQGELLFDTRDLPPRRRSRAILEKLTGPRQAREPSTEERRRGTWLAALEGREDRDSQVAAALVRFMAGEKRALDGYPALQGVFELQAGDPA